MFLLSNMGSSKLSVIRFLFLQIVPTAWNTAPPYRPLSTCVTTCVLSEASSKHGQNGPHQQPSNAFCRNHALHCAHQCHW